MREPTSYSMYAISGPSSVYHLLYPDRDYTLCGFKAERSDAQIPAKAKLHIVQVVPPDRELCKQCVKMNSRRQGNNGGPGSSNPNPKFLLLEQSSSPVHSAFQVHQ
jgi:hypothetical protein